MPRTSNFKFQILMLVFEVQYPQSKFSIVMIEVSYQLEHTKYHSVLVDPKPTRIDES